MISIIPVKTGTYLFNGVVNNSNYTTKIDVLVVNIKSKMTYH
jgi:hypothetical protein